MNIRVTQIMFFTLDIGTEVIAYPDTEARIGKGIVELRIESVGVAGPLHILHQKITYIQAQIQFVAQQSYRLPLYPP